MSVCETTVKGQKTCLSFLASSIIFVVAFANQCSASCGRRHLNMFPMLLFVRRGSYGYERRILTALGVRAAVTGNVQHCKRQPRHVLTTVATIAGCARLTRSSFVQKKVILCVAVKHSTALSSHEG